MTALYNQMRAAVVNRRNTARLYLATGDLLTGRQVQLALRPALPTKSDPALVLRLMGFDPAQLASEGIVAPRPQHLLPAPLPLSDYHQHWNQAAALDALFQHGGKAAALHFLEPAPLRLPEFDAVSPFGPAKSHTWLVAQISPAGAASRERFARSIARLDAPLIIDGGWMLPLGQEAELAPLAKVYRRLPADGFTAIKPAAAAESSSEVVVRVRQHDGKTIFYAVNAASWPVELEIEFSSPETIHILSYDPDRLAEIDQRGPHGSWKVRLEPFDLVGGEIETQRVTLTGYRVTPPAAAAAHLRDQIRTARLRANSLRSPQAGDGLANPSFESPPGPEGLTGWVHARGPGIQVEVVRGAGHRSASALRLVSQPAADGSAPVVWVRSAPLPVPATGPLVAVCLVSRERHHAPADAAPGDRGQARRPREILEGQRRRERGRPPRQAADQRVGGVPLSGDRPAAGGADGLAYRVRPDGRRGSLDRRGTALRPVVRGERARRIAQEHRHRRPASRRGKSLRKPAVPDQLLAQLPPPTHRPARPAARRHYRNTFRRSRAKTRLPLHDRPAQELDSEVVAPAPLRVVAPVGIRPHRACSVER